MNALLFREFDCSHGMEYEEAKYIQDLFLNSQSRKEAFEELGLFDDFEYGIAELYHDDYEEEDEDYVTACYYFYIKPRIEFKEKYMRGRLGPDCNWLYKIADVLIGIEELEDYEIILEEL